MVRQGQELNYAMARPKVVPKLLISMIKIETGQLGCVREIGPFLQAGSGVSCIILTKAMEPAVVFVVAGIVGTIVVALYLPMFS